ncbi:hypothetical protein ESB00_16655 [Oleiharenicola lentus]|jgi:hypothetical protein|uniref:Uncharacterized protein n=1 Tax=Oleiharenicola lentus TaxID=2508720 RepID=A0A4Q1C4K2_9BACT|nr:hypothetical protein [Oleiharenicola lentus]RXK53327.1 hypothetical protein ESB00_16655 [Oleiharenicola lentus]
MAAPVAAPAPAYRKLTRMHRTLGAMSQLWLGSDHLLHVQSTGYTESYRRFYLRDIQCMLVVHTGRRTYLAITLAAIALIIVAFMSQMGAGVVGFGILAAIFAPLFLWNHLLGPGCRVVVVTAVQQENVASLCRLPKTRRVLGEVRTLIEAAQADLAVDSPAAGAAPAADTGTTPSIPPPLPPPLPTS